MLFAYAAPPHLRRLGSSDIEEQVYSYRQAGSFSEVPTPLYYFELHGLTQLLGSGVSLFKNLQDFKLCSVS